MLLCVGGKTAVPAEQAAAALRDGAAKTAHPPLTGRGGGGGLRTMSFDVPPRCLGFHVILRPTSDVAYVWYAVRA